MIANLLLRKRLTDIKGELGAHVKLYAFIAHNMITKCEFYWGSLLEDDELGNILTVVGRFLTPRSARNIVSGTGLVTDAPRSEKHSLRWYLCHCTADGIKKIEVSGTSTTNGNFR